MLFPHADSWNSLPLLRIVLGGSVGAALLALLHVPAGALLGAILGSAAVKRLGAGGPATRLPTVVSATGLVLLGGVAGASLDAGSLAALNRVSLPLALAVLFLIFANIVLAAVLVRYHGIDRLTAVLACAPGGVSEIAVTAQALGARTEIVFAVHAVRVLVVVLVVLPLLVFLLDVA